MKHLNIKAHCPKCLCKKVGVSYHDGSYTGCTYGCPEFHSGSGHMARQCKRCHFEWCEKPLDTPGATK